MPAFWEIKNWPQLGYHAFLSHSAEDREKIVAPVAHGLESQKIVPWYDQIDYPSASDPYCALRDNLIQCRHVVYFITPAMLRQGRGWCATERAYAELMQRQFSYMSADLWCLELPLIFLPSTPTTFSHIQRTVWASLLPKAKWYVRRQRRHQTRCQWAVSEIKRLIQQQENDATSLSVQIRNSPQLSQHLNNYDGLKDRVTSLFPIKLPG